MHAPYFIDAPKPIGQLTPNPGRHFGFGLRDNGDDIRFDDLRPHGNPAFLSADMRVKAKDTDQEQLSKVAILAGQKIMMTRSFQVFNPEVNGGEPEVIRECKVAIGSLHVLVKQS